MGGFYEDFPSGDFLCVFVKYPVPLAFIQDFLAFLLQGGLLQSLRRVVSCCALLCANEVCLGRGVI